MAFWTLEKRLSHNKFSYGLDCNRQYEGRYYWLEGKRRNCLRLILCIVYRGELKINLFLNHWNCLRRKQQKRRALSEGWRSITHWHFCSGPQEKNLICAKCITAWQVIHWWLSTKTKRAAAAKNMFWYHLQNFSPAPKRHKVTDNTSTLIVFVMHAIRITSVTGLELCLFNSWACRKMK